MFPRLLIPLLSTVLAHAAIASDPVRPLDKPEKWQLPDSQAWAWEQSDGQAMLRLTKQSDFKSQVRRPRNIAWFEGATFESFTLTAEVRLDLFNRGNNDLCVAFGKTSETRFYYAHLGQSADRIHLHIHLVDDADRKPITKSRVEKLQWEPERWHQLVVERNIESGLIRVQFDGEEVLLAKDRTLAEGQIGLGSFDDLGAFRNVVIVEGVSTESEEVTNP